MLHCRRQLRDRYGPQAQRLNPFYFYFGRPFVAEAVGKLPSMIPIPLFFWLPGVL